MQEYQEIREVICQNCSDQAHPRGLFSKSTRPCYRAMISSLFIFFVLELLAVKMSRAGAVPDQVSRHCKTPNILNLKSFNYISDFPENLQPRHTTFISECLSISQTYWVLRTEFMHTMTSTSASGLNPSRHKWNN
jgi:hypothetical protein